jgi:predicted HTH transcriptional regulator
MDEYAEIVEDLTMYSAEEEWFEFKENWFEPTAIGEYVSALSNAAAMAGRKSAYFVWGIRDTDHEIVGTGFLWQRNVGG